MDVPKEKMDVHPVVVIVGEAIMGDRVVDFSGILKPSTIVQATVAVPPARVVRVCSPNNPWKNKNEVQ